MPIRTVTLLLGLFWLSSAISAENVETTVTKPEETVQKTTDPKLAALAAKLPGQYGFNYAAGYDSLTIRSAIVADDGRIFVYGQYTSSYVPGPSWSVGGEIHPNRPNRLELKSVNGRSVIDLVISEDTRHLYGSVPPSGNNGDRQLSLVHHLH